jgi:hypothetical protein
LLTDNDIRPFNVIFAATNHCQESGLVQFSSNDDKEIIIHVEKLLARYGKGIDDLPTLAIKLFDVPRLDVAGLIQTQIPRKDRLREVERMRRKGKLPKDGICKLEELYLGCSAG